MVTATFLIALIFTLLYFGYDILKLYYNIPFNKVSTTILGFSLDLFFIFFWFNVICNYTWFGILMGILIGGIFGFIKNIKNIITILKN